MKTRKENILKVLENGIKEKDKYFTTVRSGNFECKFWSDTDPSFFSKRLAKIDREYAKKIAIPTKENSTAKTLANVIKSPQDCRRYFRIAFEAMKAPKNLQKYVFANLIEKCKKEDVYFLNSTCDFYTACIVPNYYKKGWENETIFGYECEYEIEDLIPANDCKIGTTVSFKIGTEKVVGEIVGYKYEKSMRKFTRNWYGSRMEFRYGEYALFYTVKYGNNKYDCVDLKRGEFSVKMRKAV